MGNKPVYRYPPRSHASTCRCDRCLPFRPRPGAWGTIERYGIIGPALLWGGIIAVAGFWPAMAWHGEGGPTGTAWRWDIQSTIGCLIWWGVLLTVILAVVLTGAHKKRAAPRVTTPVPAPVPSPPSGPDPAVTMRLLRDLEDADAAAELAEEAQSGEELDYLRIHGKLPDGWPFRGPEGGTR
jgi:hypothetical protein